MYEGLSHRQRMLNGYSGYVPASYYAMLDSMRSFPDDRSMTYLRDQGVNYVILRGGFYTEPQWSVLREQLQVREDLSLVGIFPDNASLIRLATSLVIEQNDEWLVGRRYLSLDSLAPLLEERGEENREEVLELTAA